MRSFWFFCSLSALFACSPDDPKDSTDSSSGGPVVFSDFSSEVTAGVATVVRASWTTDLETQGQVLYGVDGAFDHATPLEATATSSHEVLLLGLPARADVQWKVVVEMDGDPESAVQEVTTGDLPTALPALEVTGTSPGTYQVSTFIGGLSGPVILDENGQIVWYSIDESGLDVYRALLSSDGASVVYNAGSISGDPAADSKLVRMGFDGTVLNEITVPLLAHDFVELPDGKFGVMAVLYGETDGLRGDRIVEVTEDGTLTEVWNSWDCFDPAVDVGDDQEVGWTFGNALDYDPVEDVYYFGMRNFSSIARIDRATGTCDWVFGRTASTITLTEGSDLFLHEHQFELRDDRLLVFDNNGLSPSESRVLGYDMDFDAGTATEAWSYRSDPAVATFVLGDVTTLEDGDILVDWAASGQMDRVSAGGDLEWRVRTDLGYAFGFNTVATSMYR